VKVLTQGTDNRWVCVNTVMIVRVPLRTEKFDKLSKYKLRKKDSTDLRRRIRLPGERWLWTYSKDVQWDVVWFLRGPSFVTVQMALCIWLLYPSPVWT